ncbi:MAG TPA: redoxin domain-containing protein, partial [Acidimicrobiales bacterium]|nr:redoxin domain-containing protein [Acidimicrobiales bacterium]
AGVQVVAVTCDTRHAHRVWAEQQGYQFPLLSDFWPHGDVARAYGVFNDALGCANRATFVIDKSGTVVETFASPDLATPRDARSYRDALAKIA